MAASGGGPAAEGVIAPSVSRAPRCTGVGGSGVGGDQCGFADLGPCLLVAGAAVVLPGAPAHAVVTEGLLAAGVAPLVLQVVQVHVHDAEPLGQADTTCRRCGRAIVHLPAA